MSLWPGYYRGKELAEPALTEIPKIKIDPDQEPDVNIKVAAIADFLAPSKFRLVCANGIASVEDFAAGETITWMYPHDEIHWVIKGKAELTYSLAGTSHTEQKTVTLQEGDIFLIPLGARLTYKVDPSGPLRNVAIAMPFPSPSTMMRKGK
ncbi:cupin domain-containing protein [Chloroflexota bacterium]